ncbi:MAG TPA: serine/threonine-protein kinase [Solirubrobacteraceae bacterium]|nr:serine/threonine-protein kinase [Solirubrobacteraceae bacterium]
MTDPRIGSELGGYRIEALIGRGGMGVVYRAEDLRLGRKVALKLLAPELAANEGFRERFERESRLAAAIDHPHIIPLYEAGDAEDLVFIVMRFVDGIDLKALLEREGPLPLGRALTIAGQVGGALDAAHERGLVHRDVKPANVLVASGGGGGADASDHCYLTDFGLTKDTSQDAGLTGTGQFVGTIAYVAPEQINGAEQGGATDQYALGCVLYECLTGHQPFERDNELDIMWAHLDDEPPAVTAHRPELPPAIDAALARALAKLPEERYASCAAMVAAVRAATSAETVVGRTVVSPAPKRPAPIPAGETRLTSQPAPDGPAAPAGETRLSTPAPAAAAPAAPAAPAEARPAAARPARAWTGFAAIAAVAVIIAGIAGAVAGGSKGKDSAAAPTSVAATGGLSLRFPADWQTQPSPPAIPGLAFEDRIGLAPKGATGEGLVAGRIPSSRTRLLPAALVPDAAAGARDTVRLGKADAFRFAGLHPAGFTGAVTVYVVLTDKGRTAIACYAATPTARFDARCSALAASLELTEGRAAALAPSPQYAKALSDLLANVTGERNAARARLAAAKTQERQAAATAGLAATYATASRDVGKLAAPAAAADLNANIAAALSAIGNAYATAAGAARSGDRGRYQRARPAIQRAERALAPALGALAELGYAVG